MAGLRRRVNKRGETLWYALIYREGGRYHEQALFERDGTTRPANEKRALALAEKAEKAYRRKTPAQQKLTRYSKFTTVWPLFKAYHIDKLAKNTQSDYHWAYEGHFKTASFARKRVSNITHEDISAYVKQKLTQSPPLDPHTINNHTGMLAKFFEFAQLQGYWDGAVNPAKAMGIRQKLTNKHIVYLREPEHSLLLVDCLDPVSEEKHRVLTATLLWTGIRWSEARSLLWSQVFLGNPKHQHLRITTTAVGMDIQDTTKTPAGDRYVGVCSTLAAMLQVWSRNPLGGTLGSEKTRLGIAPGDGLVFASDAGTILSNGNFRNRQFKDAKVAAHLIDPSFPLEITVHGCRHSYAMTLLREGATSYATGRELGHSKGPLGSTGAYTHAEAERANPIAARMVERSIQTARKALAQKRKAPKRGTGSAVVSPTPPVAKVVARVSPAAKAAKTAAAKRVAGSVGIRRSPASPRKAKP